VTWFQQVLLRNGLKFYQRSIQL